MQYVNSVINSLTGNKSSTESTENKSSSTSSGANSERGAAQEQASASEAVTEGDKKIVSTLEKLDPSAPVGITTMGSSLFVEPAVPEGLAADQTEVPSADKQHIDPKAVENKSESKTLPSEEILPVNAKESNTTADVPVPPPTDLPSGELPSAGALKENPAVAAEIKASAPEADQVATQLKALVVSEVEDRVPMSAPTSENPK